MEYYKNLLEEQIKILKEAQNMALLKQNHKDVIDLSREICLAGSQLAKIRKKETRCKNDPR